MTNPLNPRLKHSPPDTNNFDRVGVATPLQEINLEGIRRDYYNSCYVPPLHPLLVYDVRGRGIAGDTLSFASISLGEGRRLVVGTHDLHFLEGHTRDDPNIAHMEEAERVLSEHFPGLEYFATAMDGKGYEVRRKVEVARQIEDILLYHLALQSARES